MRASQGERIGYESWPRWEDGRMVYKRMVCRSWRRWENGMWELAKVGGWYEGASECVPSGRSVWDEDGKEHVAFGDEDEDGKEHVPSGLG